MNFYTAIIRVLLFFIILISIFAWITYGTLEGVLGTLAYIILGLLCLFPWLIPFAGIPLGILDVLDIYGFNMYNLTLKFAHLNSSWISIFWYWFISIIGILVDLILIYLIVSWIKGLKHRKKRVKTNFALINCSIIDGNRDSKILEDGIILIENVIKSNENLGTIAAVGSKKDIKVPEKYKKIDLEGKYVLPGLINAHCHLTGSGKPTRLTKLSDEMMKKFIKLLENPLGKIILFNMMRKNALTALNAGITTLRTMGDPHYVDLKLRDKINKGKILGPNLVCAGKGICITGGHGGAMTYIADSIPEIRKAIRKNVRKRVDFIKILSTGGVMDARKIGEAGRPQMTLEEIETACFEAHRGGLLVATHCESTEGIKEALQGGVDSIEHAAVITDDLITLFKNNPKALRGYSVLTPTISAGMGLATLPIEDTKIMLESFENAKFVEKGMIYALQKAYLEGINISCGTDASVPYSTHYELWKELKYYLRYTKMTPQEAIFYATKGNAKNIGIDNFTGSIETGKSADMIVVPGNPFENIDYLSEVVMVIIRGSLISKPKIKKIKKLKELIPIEL